MKRQFAIVMIATILLSVLTVIPVMSQSKDENVTHFIPEVDKATGICKMLYYSTEEDFVTQGPEPPDGNPIISDGDLLGPGCVVFARNKKLLEKFDTERDLGLDAADVLDEKRFLVAFSTSLDDPNGQFTAGDLLVTNGAVIPNIALLAKCDIQRADLGLDAVHFIGDVDSIIKFLEHASTVSRDEWLKNLPGLLEEYNIDIWFSTEGTAPTPEAPQFLDGDLLSARTGTIVFANRDLLPSSVPAGIPDRGVDFGLDAVISDRDGNKEMVHFSTEILNEERPSFTDGDVLLFGNGVVCTNYELIKCFEPKTKELGLDALAITIGGPIPPCAAVIIQVGGMAAGSINSDGLANGSSATTPIFEAFDSPFGGAVKILGRMPSCEECKRFKVEYGEWPDSSTPPTTFIPMTDDFKEWQFIWPSIWILTDRVPDSDGWLDILCDTIMGGLYYPWDTAGKDGKYSLKLTIEDNGGVQHVSSPVVVMVDNTRPKAVLSIDAVPECGDIFVGDTVTGKITGTDEHFYSYQLRYESSLASGNILPVRNYTGVADHGDTALSFTWNTTGLPACGYQIRLWVWDRTIVNNHRVWGVPGYGWRWYDYSYFCLETGE
ncbi:MAG: hypothetical protein WBB08_02255 [Halobacteriota archaeon]